MKKSVGKSGIVTLVLGCVSFGWLIYDLVAFEYIRPKTLRYEELGDFEETLGAFVWLGYVSVVLFHLSAIFTLITQIKHAGRLTAFRIAMLLFGIISLVLLAGDYGMLNDIGKEYKMGWETQGEWTVLYIILAIHALFHIGVFATLFRSFRSAEEETEQKARKDEVIFVTAQYVGILCGLLGLWMNISHIQRQMAADNQKQLIPFYVLALMPYGLIVASWLLVKLSEKPAGWYDEKQWLDVSKAAFVALLASIPGMAMLFLMKQPIGALWFPHYLFLVLLVFSGSVLFNIKRG